MSICIGPVKATPSSVSCATELVDPMEFVLISPLITDEEGPRLEDSLELFTPEEGLRLFVPEGGLGLAIGVVVDKSS